MFIQTQPTPNPATVKFIPGQTILEKGTMEFKSLEECTDSPLAERLFRIAGVAGVFLGQDFISVTKAEDTDWSVLRSMILAALMEHLSTGQEVVRQGAQDKAAPVVDGPDSEIVSQIIELIETRVRPSVMMDGGDIVFDRFEDGIVYLQMKGACSGCPSSTMTLKSGVENMLKHFIPEVLEVRPVAA